MLRVISVALDEPRSTSLKTSGCSRLLTCPAAGMTASRAPGIRAPSTRIGMGVVKSSWPTTTSVGRMAWAVPPSRDGLPWPSGRPRCRSPVSAGSFGRCTPPKSGFVLKRCCAEQFRQHDVRHGAGPFPVGSLGEMETSGATLTDYPLGLGYLPIPRPGRRWRCCLRTRG